MPASSSCSTDWLAAQCAGAIANANMHDMKLDQATWLNSRSDHYAVLSRMAIIYTNAIIYQVHQRHHAL